jgi:hypothetical protein
VNGVARANGRNNTFFRTDGRFYNPSSRDAVVTVSFHASGDSNGAPATRDFTIPAGRILDVTDVLDTLLGIPVGLAGALRFQSSSPVAILCRTSNVDPAGIKPGTYGAQQKPASLLSFLMSADAGAVVTGIRQNATFRTNIGFAAGADGAAYSLTLKSTSGATVATSAGSLGAFGWTQPNVQDLFSSVTIPDDATLLVKVTSGSVDVFDSSIDNASGDPVVTPIMPLPLGIPSSATIGSQGGSIRSSDGRFTLKVPAGALSTSTAFSVVPVANAAPDGVGAAYEVTPDPFGLTGAGVVLTYVPGDLEGSGASALAVVALDGGTWRNVQRGGVDTVRRTVTVPLAFPASGTAARSSAVRRSLDQGTTAIALQKMISLTPSREALITNQSTILQVRGPVAALPAAAWTLEGQPLNDTTYGTLSPNGVLATYKAPATEPSKDHNPVFIRASYVVGSGEEEIWVEAKVRILQRTWEFVTKATLGWSCGRIEGCFEALSYSNVHFLDFDLDESLAIVPSFSKPAQTVTNDLTKCNFPPDSGIKCSGGFTPYDVVPALPHLLTGRYDKDKDGFSLAIDMLSAFYAGGNYHNCTQVEASIGDFASSGMAALFLEGFQIGPHIDLFVPFEEIDNPENSIYRFSDIYSVKGGVLR